MVKLGAARMPVLTDVLSRYNLALFSYSGQVTFAETLAAIAAVARHPDHHDTMRQLCDLAAVTGVEQNFPELIKMQARMAEDMLPHHGEKLVVFHAPTPEAQKMAQMARKSWEGLGAVVLRIVDREEEALELLGLPVMRIEDLLTLGA